MSEKCSPAHVEIHRCVSVLPNDYTILENLPSINGVTLKGDQKAQDLNLLSINRDDYETVSLLDKEVDKESYLIVLGVEKATKVSLSDFIAQSSGFKTVDSCDEDVPVGTYLFVQKQ